MAHFAKIGLNGKVIGVHRVNNTVLKDGNGNEQEVLGIQFLTNLHGWALWKQTSYNTIKGKHREGGTPLRKNYAGRGHTYDEERDAFISPQPYPSWILDETTCHWEPPVARPADMDTGGRYRWNEETQHWDPGLVG